MPSARRCYTQSVLDHFVPGDHIPLLPIIGDHLSGLPLSSAHAYVEAYTSVNDVVLDPFCVGTGVLRAATETDRRAIVTSFNPIVVSAIEWSLWPPDARAALTHLGDARKGDRRLRDHISNLYITRCPTCGQALSARAFVWDRDARAPIAKIVECKTCGPTRAAVDDDDISAARKFEPRGLSFWLLHGKVVPRDHMDADRVEEALDAYTPRALNAIADILLKFDGLPHIDRDVLRAPLISMLDAASALHSLADDVASRAKPRSLRPPQQFIEYNPWLALEIAVDQTPLRASITRSPDLATLLASSEPAVYLSISTSRDLSKQLPPGSIDLLLTRPPLPDIPFWTLSAVWSHWLWRKSDPNPAMFPLLAQRRTNWDWQWRASASALRPLWSALKTNAHGILSFNAEEAISLSALDSVTLSVAASGASPVSILCDPFDGYRIHAQAQPSRSIARDRVALAQDIAHIAVQAMTKTLRVRGEPSNSIVLRAATLEALAAEGLLGVLAELPADGPQPLSVLRDAIEEAQNSFDAIDDLNWWFTDAQKTEDALADRVERTVLKALQAQATWNESELLLEVYRHFTDHQTPERPWVAACILSYSESIDDDHVGLRKEDQSEARVAEVESIRHELMQLGQQLNYTIETGNTRIVWKDDRTSVYTLVVSSSAERKIIERIAQRVEGTPILVIPGSRATLFQHKLARDARLRKMIEQGNWQFLKFNAIRELLTHTDMDRRAFTLALGLDPPLEQPQVQIPLL